MATIETVVTGIGTKVNQLIGRLESLQEENNQIKKTIHSLNQEKQIQNETIEELKQQITLLTEAQTAKTTGERIPDEKKINELLREIDQCLGMLSR